MIKPGTLKNDWILILMSGVFAYTALNSIKRGEITPMFYYTYSRNRNPIVFWIATSFYFAAAIGSIILIFVPQ